MIVSEVVIRLDLEHLDFKGSKEALKESVYKQLIDLIENNDLHYAIESWRV